MCDNTLVLLVIFLCLGFPVKNISTLDAKLFSDLNEYKSTLQREKRATDDLLSSPPTNVDCGIPPDPIVEEHVGVPWHATIYKKESDAYKHICSGSIISKTVVISAANCFWDTQKTRLHPTSLFAVAVGKRRRPWMDTEKEEARAQRFNVTDIKIPARFRGIDSNFEFDIALAILEKEIRFSQFTMPVCIDQVSGQVDLRTGSLGTITGWGVLPVNNSLNDVLRTVLLPYINTADCFDRAPNGFIRLITRDKMCAGENNGTKICVGDAGAGMAFLDLFRDKPRYYLRGVLSIAPAPTTGDSCGPTPLLALTRISSHTDLIAENVVLDYGLGINAECGISGRVGGEHEMPWYAAVYKNINNNLRRLCAGSLISHNVVISVAHCFWDNGMNKLHDIKDYMVVLGKYHIEWGNPLDTDVQTSTISSITVGPKFDNRQYADDIALLFLAKEIRFTTTVRPVCVNFDQDFDRQQTQFAMTGKMPGFGVKPVNGNISDVINVVELPLIDRIECIRIAPQGFRNFLVTDKICAGFQSGTRICKGDSGTGLVFRDSLNGLPKYYLRGILSVATLDDTSNLCFNASVIGFTWLLSHENLIAGEVVDSPRVSAKEIKKAVKTECGILQLHLDPLSIGGRVANHSEMPWHAGIYKKHYYREENRFDYEQICGGSLVSSNLVISAAHCFANDEGVRRKTHRFAVAVGKLYRDWNDPRDIGDSVQKSNVSNIIMPDNFYGSVTRFQADIALVKLASQFQYKENVVPVCLDFDYEFDKRQLRGGSYGKVAGWGYINEEGVSSPVLKIVEEPIYNSSACFQAIPTSSRELITTDKICGGYVDGSQALCKGDSGGGLVVPAVEGGIVRYYLRGIVSTATTSIKKCNRFSLTYFTRVRAHQYLITESLTNTIDSIETTSARAQITSQRTRTTQILRNTERTQTPPKDVDDRIHFIND